MRILFSSSNLAPLNDKSAKFSYSKNPAKENHYFDSRSYQNNDLSSVTSLGISNINAVQVVKRREPVGSITFAGNPNKNQKQYLHIAAEMDPLAKTGGEAVVVGDFAHVFPKFNNSEHSFMIPYYNAEEIKNENGFTTGYKMRHSADGKPVYVKQGTKEEIPLEEVASKKIKWGQRSALENDDAEVKLYRVARSFLDKQGHPQETNIYMVYAPMTASMKKEYGMAYNDGNMGNAYSQFSKAVTELLPELEKDNFVPAKIIGHDWHTAPALKFMHDSAVDGGYYKGSKLGYFIHNLARAYQGATSPYNLFCQIATPEEIKAVNDDPEFQKLMMDKFRRDSQPTTGTHDVDKKITEYFQKLMPELIDEEGVFNASKIPLTLAEKGYIKATTVSDKFAQEMTEIPELSLGLTKHVKKLYEEGSLNGTVNGMSTPACDPSKNQLPIVSQPVLDDAGNVIHEPFKTFDASMPAEQIRQIKHENKMNLLGRIATEEGEQLDPKRLIVRYDPEVNNLYGQIDKKILDNKNLELCVGWGRGDFQKGLDISLESVTRDAHSNPNRVYLFGGALVKDNPESAKVLKIIEKMSKDPLLKGRFVFIDGFAPAYAFASAGDFAIFNSRFEPCGLTQFEAMKFGCIPLTTNTGGFGQTIFDIDDNSLGEEVKRNGYKTKHGFYMPDETITSLYPEYGEKIAKLNIHTEVDKIEELRREYRDRIVVDEITELLSKSSNLTHEVKNEIMMNGMTCKTGWMENHAYNFGQSALERHEEHFFNNKKSPYIEPGQKLLKPLEKSSQPVVKDTPAVTDEVVKNFGAKVEEFANASKKQLNYFERMGKVQLGLVAVASFMIGGTVAYFAKKNRTPNDLVKISSDSYTVSGSNVAKIPLINDFLLAKK